MKVNFKSNIILVLSHPVFVLFLLLIVVLAGVTFAQTLNTTGSSLLPPTSLMLDGAIGSNYVPIKWSYSLIGNEKIFIERMSNNNGNFEYLAQTSGSSYTDTNVTSGGYYYYRVKSCYVTSSGTFCSPHSNILGGIYVSNTSNTTGGSTGYGTDTTPSYIPTSPTELTFTTSSSTPVIYLEWQDNSSNEDKFNIERKLSNSANWFSSILVSGANITTYTDSTVTAGSTYDYRVQACLSNVGCSGYATVTNALVPYITTSGTNNTTTTIQTTSSNTTTPSTTAPLPPSNLMLYSQLTNTSTYIPLKWQDNSNNEEKFRIERKLSSSATFSPLKDVSANSTGYVDNNSITAGTHYDYRLKACVGDLCSPYIELLGISIPTQSTTSITTDNTVLTTTEMTTTSQTTNTFTTGNTAPLPPSGFRLYSTPTASSSSIPLKWQDNSNNEEKFRIERKLSSSATFSPLKDVSANSTGYVDNNSITAGTHYDYRLRACVGDLCSPAVYLAEVFIPIQIGTTSNTTILTIDSSSTTVNTSTTEEATKIVTEGETREIESYDSVSPEVLKILEDASVPTPKLEEMIGYDGNPLAPASTNIDTQNVPAVVSTEVETTIEDDVEEVTEALSRVVEEEKKRPEIESKDLIEKDTNNDGVSDYDSIYVYKLDPIKPSPTSVYEGKEIKASEKILLGFDPTKPELVKVNIEEPKDSKAPTVTAYKVKEVKLTEEKKVVLKGKAIPNSFVTIYIYSTPIMVTVKTDSKGEWQYVIDKELEDGEHTVYTASVNNSGNIVAKSSGYLFTKTAEAVTLNDVPIADASAGANEPSFLEGINIYVLVLLFIGAIIAAIFLIGFVTKKNNPGS
jgi:hypothetical protein